MRQGQGCVRGEWLIVPPSPAWHRADAGKRLEDSGAWPGRPFLPKHVWFPADPTGRPLAVPTGSCLFPDAQGEARAGRAGLGPLPGCATQWASQGAA